ncbi:MAG TPA: hypothetical protein VHU85_17780 [Acidimicrobiales bacterium]|jgi:hypothetical protein|nr:hypothetical protein [Acidimicrobiales bacterium]
MTTLLSASPNIDEELLNGVTQIDLSMVRAKLMDPEEGSGWTMAHAQRVEIEYRRYLALARRYPSRAVVPSKIVDTFWHYHILDTQAYAKDCELAFGYFLHHFPYFGMRGDDDKRALDEAYDETLHLYEDHFGTPPADIWVRSGMARCPKCGRAS